MHCKDIEKKDLLCQGRRQMHPCHGATEFFLILWAAQCQVLHDDVASPTAIVAIMIDFGDAHGSGMVHGHKPQRLALEHAVSALTRGLHEKPFVSSRVHVLFRARSSQEKQQTLAEVCTTQRGLCNMELREGFVRN